MLDSYPVVPTAATDSALHLSALGSIPKLEGGGASPASSITSEQQSLADVEEHKHMPGASSGVSTDRKSKTMSLAAAGRKLSFARTLGKPKK